MHRGDPPRCFVMLSGINWITGNRLMISFIRGTVSYIGESFLILEANSMGFTIFMPSSSLYQVSEGMEIKIHTHLAVREDDLSLYGFLSQEDLNMFRQLIGVSGIGPRGALGILSSITTEELKMAIASEDAKLISSAKGIGMKTAQKIVVDLKGKFKNIVPSSVISSASSAAGNVETAILFAQSTGISRAQCLKALSQAKISPEADVDSIIDLIFKNIQL